MRKRSFPSTAVVAAVFLFFHQLGPDSPHPPPVFGATADVQEEVTVRVEFDVTSLYEHRFKAGDPSVTVTLTNEVNFTRSDLLTISRLRGPREAYRASSGRPMKFPDVKNLSVRETHPCQDGEGLLIGRESRQVSARVHPASGCITVEAAGRGKVRLHLLPVTIDESVYVDCPKENCQNGFGGDRPFLGWGRIGENPRATTTDEEGYDTIYGFDIGVVDWSTLKAIADGAELPLAFPIGVEDVYQVDSRDHLGQPERETVTYRVRGTISTAPKSDGVISPLSAGTRRLPPFTEGKTSRCAARYVRSLSVTAAKEPELKSPK